MGKIQTSISAYDTASGVDKAGTAIASVDATYACVALTSTAGAGATGNSITKLQGSLDGLVGWFDIASATVTSSSSEFNANTSKGFGIALNKCFPFVRASFDGDAAISAGVITVKMYLA